MCSLHCTKMISKYFATVMNGGCIVIDNAVSSICRKMNDNMMCAYMAAMGIYMDSMPLPAEHRTIPGIVSVRVPSFLYAYDFHDFAGIIFRQPISSWQTGRLKCGKA
ncbi:hypothetical protein KIN20_005713 [Parelaphostrongylus tenuis]|uniref:Uncharacterized protein n=1 Tax=Parelaphostrongylus tenuis TaxID=148309 RepID=A0AAD5MJB8_PARTN|nr:hypothetical protein KIN20_005713 [Parelaphostrongylus tenuis]